MSNQDLLDNLLKWRGEYAEFGGKSCAESIDLASFEVLRRMNGRGRNRPK